MSQQHLADFIAHLRTLNPQINIDGRIGQRTRVQPLIDFLRRSADDPKPIRRYEALQLCGALGDPPSLGSYLSAVDRLVSVWGHAGQAYPSEDVETIRAARSRANFERLVAAIPAELRPTWEQIDEYRFELRATKNLKRLGTTTQQGASAADVTARGLFLTSGLDAPTSDNQHLLGLLRLDAAQLEALRYKSVLDAGAGGSFLYAELECLFGCSTVAMDLQPWSAKMRKPDLLAPYVASMLRLKLLRDRDDLRSTGIATEQYELLDEAVANVCDIVQIYRMREVRQGDILSATTPAEFGRFDYCISANVLGYFTATQQLTAMFRLCAMTRRTLFVHAGGQLGGLSYDQQQLRARYPGLGIHVKSPWLHHVDMRAVVP